MSDIVACPSCQRKLRIPVNLQGQPVKCPACQHTFTPSDLAAPSPPPPPGLPRMELDSEPPPPPRRSGEDSSRDRDREDPEPRRSRRRDPDEDEDDDRPRRRRSRRDEDDDDYDDRPRRRRRYQDEHRGGVILALGICAIVCFFTFITGPMAWIMGSSDLAAMREGRMDPEGEGLTRTGYILGMIGTILFIVGCVSCGVLFAIASAHR